MPEGGKVVTSTEVARKPSGVPSAKRVLTLESIREIICDPTINPLRGMIKVAQHPDASLDLQGRMWAELAQYVYPKLRSVEHKIDRGDPNLLSDDELLALIAEQREREGRIEDVEDESEEENED